MSDQSERFAAKRQAYIDTKRKEFPHWFADSGKATEMTQTCFEDCADNAAGDFDHVHREDQLSTIPASEVKCIVELIHELENEYIRVLHGSTHADPRSVVDSLCRWADRMEGIERHSFANSNAWSYCTICNRLLEAEVHTTEFGR